MEFTNLIDGFTDEQKYKSFQILQEYILNKQKGDEKFFIGRLSGNETRLSGLVLKNKPIEQMLIYNMLYVAGIQLSGYADIDKFIKLYDNSIKSCELLGIWSGSMYTQAIDYYNIIDEKYPDKKKICSQGLEPFYFMNKENYKFNEIFTNKKVLIITSHYNTTLKQLENHNKIYPKRIFDDNTEFKIYKPPQQNGGSHDGNPWIYHFNIIKSDLKKIKDEYNFDIALVSCGGFGMITSNYIYEELDTSVMYIGGGLQLFFGIFGNRWHNNKCILSLRNEYWTRPIDSDKPSNIEFCENGCYW